jgi:predicted dehydrogenase
VLEGGGDRLTGIVRVGVVSATGTGRKRTLPALLGSDTCKVTAVHARDQVKISELGRDFHIPHVYTDLGKMISEGQFDLAVVCSPPFLHREQLEMLLSAGIPTLCEKPLALSEQDALAIQETAERTGTPVTVAHQLRHQSTYADIKATLAAGEIGEIESATTEWNYVLDRADPRVAWKLDPALNGPTCLTDAGVHCIDLAIGLFGPGTLWGVWAPSRRDGAVIETCELLAVHSGIRVTYEVSRLHKALVNNLAINGSMGQIVARGFFTESSAPRVTILVDGDERTVKRRAGNPYRQVVEDFAAALFEPDFISPGTTLAEAVSACRIIDEAQAALGA